MEQNPINQRVKFLAEKLADSARAFSLQIGESTTNTHKYINGNTRPSPEFLEKIVVRFGNVNAQWLLTGQGEPFLDEGPKTGITQTGNFNQAGTKNVQKVKGNKGNVIGTNHGTAMLQNGVPLPDDKTAAALALAEREIQHLRDKLAASEALVASKEETISVLRAAFTRPN